jgi:hypothetical protein
VAGLHVWTTEANALALASKAAHLGRRAQDVWKASQRDAAVLMVGDEEDWWECHKLARQASGLATHLRRQERQAGRYIDNVTSLVVAHLNLAMQANGWADRRWPPVPARVAALCGRRWGSTNNNEGPPLVYGEEDGRPKADPLAELIRRTHYQWTRKVHLSPDPALVDKVQRIAYHQDITVGDILRPAIATAAADWWPAVTDHWATESPARPEWAPLPHLTITKPQKRTRKANKPTTTSPSTPAAKVS